MARETMTREERIFAAINLEKPDRTPLAPLLTNHGAAALTGRTQAEVHLDPHSALDAFLEVFDRHDGWDMFEYPIPCMPVRWGYKAGLEVKIPGRDLPDDYVPQPHEQEAVKVEDYEKISEVGWKKFSEEDLIYRVTDLSQDELDKINGASVNVAERALKEWGKRDVVTACLAEDYHPFFKLSLSRSMMKFTEDLYYRPDVVEKAMKKMTEETIENILADAKKYDTKIVGLVEERASGYFYPLDIFERFWMPYTMQIVDALHSEGLITHFHCDCNWEKNLPYFKQLPKKSSIIALDGTTDIFKAKEIIGDHLCLEGDVHPSLNSIGKPEEVEAYVKRLIDEVGYNGGLIVGVGCEVPSTCKRENFKMMIETGKNYEFSKK